MGRLISLVLLLFIDPVFGQIKPERQESLHNDTFTAKVVRVMDGDTMEALYKNKLLKIRLAHIDCPEKRSSQPFYANSKKALSDLCFGQYVTVITENIDRYGRLICLVMNTKKQIVNQEMVRQGMAWHFKKYSREPLYAKLEQEARTNRVGLWRSPNPIPPWEWRKPKR